MSTKPYAVVRIHSPRKVAGYYEDLIERSPADLGHLRDRINAARQEGPTETVIARYSNPEAAQADARRRNATSVPGVTYRADWDDSGY